MNPSETRSVSSRGRGRLIESLKSFKNPISSDSGVQEATGESSGSGKQKSSDADEFTATQSTSGSSVEVLPAQPELKRTIGRGQLLKQITQATRSSAFGVTDLRKEVEALDKSADEGSSSKSSESIRAERAPVLKSGTTGKQVPAVANYVRLHVDRNSGIYEYEVRFKPSTHSVNVCKRALNDHSELLGRTKSFDGRVLYLPRLLPDHITELKSHLRSDPTSVINIRITFKRQRQLAECTYLCNVLFNRIMDSLNYVQFNRKHFDPTRPKLIPQHKLEIWPGYVTAIDEYEDGVMLCMDVSHRVLCQMTVLDLIKQAIYSDRQNNTSDYQSNAKKALLGSVVITRYNNKTYRIDDIDFNQSPRSTFQTRNGEISYFDYYRQQYNIEIKESEQPMLMNLSKKRVAGKTDPIEMLFCLVPELCYLTGLTDTMRSDFRVMRDVASFTRVTPNQRMYAVQKFCENVNSNERTRQILSDWGMRLHDDSLKVTARQLKDEEVLFGGGRMAVINAGDFNRDLTRNQMLDVIHITNWQLISVRSFQRNIQTFLQLIERCATSTGISIARPHEIVLNDDKTETYVKSLRQNLRSDTQIVVFICPTSRDDRYAAIKKICCSEMPVPTQVINSPTLNNDGKNRGIVQKILLQMNCKLGGALWQIDIPFNRFVMICGMDTYHEQGQRSVSAFVASLNQQFTQYYSVPILQERKEELINGLCTAMVDSLKAFERRNGVLPESVILYRDGIGDGQFDMCIEYEIPQLKAAISYTYPNYEPTITLIVVQKRINTRIFVNGNNELMNPNPGCVIDHTITRRYLYDFFLISQNVRQGSVTPTHYVVIYDTFDFKPDVLQRLTYKMCYLYYNWPGGIRVPATCQYAHKLAYLVGKSIKRKTADSLAEKLFYL